MLYIISCTHPDSSCTELQDLTVMQHTLLCALHSALIQTDYHSGSVVHKCNVMASWKAVNQKVALCTLLVKVQHHDKLDGLEPKGNTVNVGYNDA